MDDWRREERSRAERDNRSPAAIAPLLPSNQTGANCQRQPEGRGGAAESTTPVRLSWFFVHGSALVVRGSLRGFAAAHALHSVFRGLEDRRQTWGECRGSSFLDQPRPPGSKVTAHHSSFLIRHSPSPSPTVENPWPVSPRSIRDDTPLPSSGRSTAVHARSGPETTPADHLLASWQTRRSRVHRPLGK